MILGSLAYAEMRLILARVLWNFDMELDPSSLEWDNQKVGGMFSPQSYSPDTSRFILFGRRCL